MPFGANMLDYASPTVKNKSPRNATFELLRIFSMLLIVSQHFLGHGNWIAMQGLNSVLAAFTDAIFRPSVNVFVMISAYFMCMRDDMRVPWKKLGKLWLTMFFYSSVLYIAFTAAGIYEFSAVDLVYSLFPIVGQKYWFVSAYFIMVLASPLLNALVHRLKKPQFAFLCAALIVIAAVQDLGLFSSTLPLTRGYSASWFFFLYLITAFIRKYDINLNTVPWIVGAIGFIGVTILIALIWKNPGYNSIVTIYMSVFILLTAKKITISNVKLSKAICTVSGFTFGVYLIHDSNEMRGYMYEQIFHSSQFISSDWAYLIFVGFVLATFTACACIEWVRVLGFKGVALLSRHLFGDKIDALKDSLNKFISRIVDCKKTCPIPEKLS